MSLKLIVENNFSKNKRVFAALLDLKKSFDSTDHFQTFEELFNLNIPDDLIAGLKLFYINPTASVASGSLRSDPFYPNVGVRQGGTSSPILFALYINELPKILEEANLGIKTGDLWTGIILFADDIILLANSKSELEKMISMASSFLKEKKLYLNPLKCNFIIFNKNNRPTKSSITIDGERLLGSKQVTYLGITFSSGFDLLPELGLRSGKLSSALASFRSTGLYLVSSRQKRTLWFSVGVTQALYGAECWTLKDPSKESKALEKLEKAHRRGLRWTLSRTPTNVSNNYLYYEANALSIGSLVKTRKALFVLRLFSSKTKTLLFTIWNEISKNIINRFESSALELYNLDKEFEISSKLSSLNSKSEITEETKKYYQNIKQKIQNQFFTLIKSNIEGASSLSSIKEFDSDNISPQKRFNFFSSDNHPGISKLDP